VLMVLDVGVVVCAIAGVAIMAAMAIAPYKCDLMFRLPSVYRTTGTLMPAPELRLSEAPYARWRVQPAIQIVDAIRAGDEAMS
jgi:hypothetical protein